MKEILLSDQFIDIFNELDNFLRNKYGYQDRHIGFGKMIDELVYDKNNLIIKEYKDKLATVADLRNIIVHSKRGSDMKPIAEPHLEVVETLERIKEKVMNPPKALNKIATGISKISYASMNDNAMKVMIKMHEKNFSHIPILDDGKVVGVFSEDTIFSYLTENQIVAIDKDITINEFKEYIPVDKHINEFFIYENKDITIDKVIPLFQGDLKNNKRLAAVFLTENGQPQERLLGMITIWDIAGYDLTK